MKNLANIFDTIKQFVLGIAVAVLIPFIGYYCVILIQPKPTYQPNFQPGPEVLAKSSEKIGDLKETEKALIVSTQSSAKKDLEIVRKELEQVKRQHDELEVNFKKQEQTAQGIYNKELEKYEKISFYICATLGLIAFIIGFLLHSAFLGFGFFIGGLVCLTMGYYNYWGRINTILKLGSLILALLLILGLSFKFLVKKTK